MHDLTSLDFVVAVGDNRAPPHQCAFIAFVYAIFHWFTYLSLSFSFGNRNRDTSELYVVLWHPIAAHILPPRLVGWASAIVSWSVQPPDGVTGALISVIPPSAMSYLYIVFDYTIQINEFFWSLYGIGKKCDPAKYGIYKILVHYNCYFHSVWLPFIFFCVPLCYLSLSIIEVCYVKVKFM